MPRPRHGNQEESASEGEEDGAPGRRAVRIRLGSFISEGPGPAPRTRSRESAVRTDRLLGGLLEVTSARGVRGPERVLLDALDVGLSGRVLVAGGREGLVAIAAALLHPDARVDLFSLDAYEARRAREAIAANGAQGVRVILGADLPRGEPYDWVLFPVPRQGDAMLSQEIIAEAHAALTPGGKILAASDNPKDRWVRERILDTFGSATIHARGKQGLAYIARRRPGHEPRIREFRRTFRARLLGREIELETRPGVFSHGELDDGARALAEAAPVREDSRVIDLGCGSGTIGIIAALAAPRGKALLVDSQPRSVQAARAAAVRNGASNALVILAEDLGAAAEGSFDLVLANPPYYADHRITEHFAREGFRALRTGGEILLVTKTPGRAGEILRSIFGECSAEERRGYTVLRAVKKAAGPSSIESRRSSRR
jgi:16S rRNA (guanine1207-N2)-methyltransferase